MNIHSDQWSALLDAINAQTDQLKLANMLKVEELEKATMKRDIANMYRTAIAGPSMEGSA